MLVFGGCKQPSLFFKGETSSEIALSTTDQGQQNLGLPCRSAGIIDVQDGIEPRFVQIFRQVFFNALRIPPFGIEMIIDLNECPVGLDMLFPLRVMTLVFYVPKNPGGCFRK